MKKALSIFFAVVIVCILPMTGCGNYKNKISIGLDAFPSTLDPQLEAHKPGASVFSFLFSGLLQYGKDGMLHPDVAEQFFFSEDGLKLTFILRADRFWQDGSRVTSYDFAFALKRVLSPETESAYAKTLFSISGAEAFFNKTAAEVAGISCPDKSTLILTLDYIDEVFLYAFAAPHLSPCNETFFYQKDGSYGMTAAQTLLNGSYTVNSRGDTQLILRKNKDKKTEKTLPAEIVFFKSASVSASELASRLKSGKAAMALSAQQLTVDNRVEKQNIENSTWAVSFGAGVNKASRDERLFLALAYGGLGELQQENRVTHLLPAAYANYYLSKPLPARASDNAAAKDFIKSLLTDYKLTALPKITLLIPDEDEARALSDLLVAVWQKNINAFITREYYSRSKIFSMMKNGDYDAALFPVEYTQSTPAAFYRELSSQIGASDLIDAQLDAIEAYSGQDFAKTAEQILFDSRRIFPVDKKCVYVYSASGLSRIYYNPRAGIIDLE